MRLFKILIVIAVLECIYLFAAPVFLQHFLTGDFIIKTLEKNSNISLNIEKLTVKTGITPSILINMQKISAYNKLSGQPLFLSNNTNIGIKLIPLLFKKFSPEYFYSDNLQFYLNKNDDGTLNFENLFTKKENNSLKLDFKNFDIKTKGTFYIDDSRADFDIDINYSLPVSLKNFSNNELTGKVFFYNINLNELYPFLKKINPNVKEMSGFIDYIQISTEKKDGIKYQTVINTRFNDLLYLQQDWTSSISARGENNINAELELYNDTIHFNHLKYNADNIFVYSDGDVVLKSKPQLDINVEIKNSKTENIVSLLPSNLVKETMIIDKVKKYGIKGVIEGKTNIKGIVPNPNISGFVKGRNIRILDVKTNRQHSAKVDINFDNRKLNMDILINMPNKQNAKVKGTTYMYRDGINDVSVKTTNNIDLSLAQKLVLPISDTFNFQLGPIKDMNIKKGRGIIDINIKGSMDFIDLNGYCSFDSADLTYYGLFGNISNTKGRIDFKGDKIIIKSYRAFIKNNPFSLNGLVILNNNLNFDLRANSANAEDLLEIINKSELLKDVKKGLLLFKKVSGRTDLLLNYSADIVPVPFGHPPLPPEEAFKNMKVNGKLTLFDDVCYLDGFYTPLNNIRGDINFTETVVDFKNLNITSGVSTLNVDGKIDTDIKTKVPDVDILITGDTIKAGDTIKFLAESILYPKNYLDLSQLYNLETQHDLYLKYKDKSVIFNPEKIYALINVQKDNISKIHIDDFSIKLENDKLEANNITAEIEDMPVFANLKLKNISKTPYIESYITSKLTNNFIKNGFNEILSNKVAVSGDINFSADIKGTFDNLDIKPKITLFPGADAVLSGIKLGDSSDKRVFNSDIKISDNKISINNFDYYKYITTQNNTVYPALFANGNGVLEYNQKTLNYEPKSIYIKTEKSLSAKLLNAFLDKPIFNQGTINCDIKYQNNQLDGQIEAKNIDIPLVDTVIKNIKLNTDEKHIDLRLFGFINDSVIRVQSSLDNDTKHPLHIDLLKIYTDKADTNKILESIANARREFNSNKEKISALPAFQIEKGELHIDLLKVKNYEVQDADSNFSIDKDGNFRLNNINIKSGEGNITGEVLYDLADNDFMAQLDFKNIDSNYMAENLFDIHNQIYGTANANFLIKTSGNSDDEIIKNLSGFAYFDITDAKMPKLGSLEYLLRASNVIKGGVTGFSINNILEILNLVKTGHFTNINGECKLNQGKADNIEIFAQGENLSLYLHGGYDISNTLADMEILGKLSNRISTIFGPIGNASLNTFFKYIPGISLLDFGRKDIINNVEKIPQFTGGNYDSRTFQAIIRGDINSSEYVQSFKWVKIK